VREGAFTEVCKCPELEHLSLLGARVPADELAAVAGLKRLRFLISDQPVTEAFVRGLGQCRRLEYLSLDGPGLTDGMVKTLAGLPSLQQLSIRGPAITDEALRDLEGMRALWSLELSGAKVTEAGLERFRKARPWVKVEIR
jgi:hypothetical protein